MFRRIFLNTATQKRVQDHLLVVLRLLIAVECIGFGLKYYQQGSPTMSFLFLKTELPETMLVYFDKSLSILFLFSALFLAFRWNLILVSILSIWIFLNAFFLTFFGGEFFREVIIFAQSSRYLFPIFMALWVFCFKSQSRDAVFYIEVFLKVAISVTFFAHGLEALAYHPTFIDYLIVGFSRLFQISLSQSHAQILLLLIGVLDIFVSLLVWTNRAFLALIYMIFWGFLTSLIRVVYSPNLLGLEEAMIRTAHWGIPLFLSFRFLATKQFLFKPFGTSKHVRGSLFHQQPKAKKGLSEIL